MGHVLCIAYGAFQIVWMETPNEVWTRKSIIDWLSHRKHWHHFIYIVYYSAWTLILNSYWVSLFSLHHPCSDWWEWTRKWSLVPLKVKLKWVSNTCHNHRGARVVLLLCLSSLVSKLRILCSFTYRTWILFPFWLISFLVDMAANEALARVASLGLLPNMILYLMGSYKLHLAKATQILLLSSASSNFTPVVGAFIADAYLGRFLAVGLGSAISFLVFFVFFYCLWFLPE